MAQASWWIEYTDDWRRRAPLAYWVHVEQDGKHFDLSERMAPPAPRPIPHKGYPVLCVDFQGVVLRFTSRAQLTGCIRVLSLRRCRPRIACRRCGPPAWGPTATG